MADKRAVPTALGEPVEFGKGVAARMQIKPGRPPVVLQTQAYAYIPLESPEQLKQWEQDMRSFYGISVDASDMAGVACETCSCGCTDDCGLLA